LGFTSLAEFNLEELIFVFPILPAFSQLAVKVRAGVGAQTDYLSGEDAFLPGPQ
jgi:hypothetical protein